MIANSLAIYQGKLQDISPDVNIVAAKLATAQVVAISHVYTVDDTFMINPSACRDVAYPEMAVLLPKIKQLSPTTKIFGYVPATVDAPYDSGCGYIHPNNKWTPPNGICSNFIKWTNKWRVHQAYLDGIFIDLVAPHYISAIVRDSVISYCKNIGFKVMLNCPLADYNVEFGCQCSYLGKGDYICIEGFCYANGNYWLTTGQAAISKFNQYRNKGINVACLTTESWSTGANQTISTAWPNFGYAKAEFNKQFKTGDVMQYTRADLGIVSKVCDINSPN